MEQWRDIIGYEGLYKISSFGRVLSLHRPNLIINNPELIIKPFIKKNGYLQINLSKIGNKRKFYIHRLVAIHFIPFIPQMEHVNHLDGNKTNNNVYNLEWTNIKLNNQHMYKTGLKKVKISKELHRVIKERVKNCESPLDLAKEYNVHFSTIYRVLKDKLHIQYS
jgi:hypothetical protein